MFGGVTKNQIMGRAWSNWGVRQQGILKVHHVCSSSSLQFWQQLSKTGSELEKWQTQQGHGCGAGVISFWRMWVA